MQPVAGILDARRAMPVGSIYDHSDAKKASLTEVVNKAAESRMHDKFLTYFDEVARHGSIRKAAAHLNVSSSSVNRKIISIEDRLGIKLFDRHADGVEVTSAGAVVLEHCRKTIFDYQKILTTVEDIRELRAGHINIAALDSVAISILPEALEKFSAAYPEISFVVQTAQPSEVMQGVSDGEVDIGISFCNDLLPGVRVHTEKATPIGAIMRPDHPLAERDTLEIKDLSNFHLIRSYDGASERSLWSEALENTDVTVSTQANTNSLPLARALIKRSQSIGIYTKIGFLEEIDTGLLHYIALQSPVLSGLRIGILISSRSGLTSANHLLSRSLSKALRTLRLDS